MARSVRSLIDEVRVQLRDTSGSQQLYSYSEAYRAVQQAFRHAAGFFPVPDVHTSLILSTGLRQYTLPSQVRNIRSIEYEVVPGGISTVPLVYPLRSWRHVPAQETNLLYVDGDFPDYPTRVYYDRDLIVPPLEATLATNVTSTQSFIPVVNSGGEFPRAWLPWLPSYIQLGDEVIRVGAVTATSFTDIIRGFFGTAPRANSLSNGMGMTWESNRALTPYIHYDHADEFLMARTKYELMFTRMQDAEGEANRNLSVLAGEFGRQAEDAKLRYSPERTPRVFQLRMPPRK